MNKNNNEVMNIVNQFDKDELVSAFNGAKMWEECQSIQSGIDYMLYYVIQQAQKRNISLTGEKS